MAGDWIKMRLDLQTHPKVVRILSATKSDKFRVVGGLHAVWSVFDTHSADGRLPGYTAETLDHIIGWPGFAKAMIEVGWLGEDDAQALVLPDFSEHNGKSGKRRAEDQKRKREDRKSPQPVRNLSDSDADKNGTREEKRREEKNKEEKHKAPPAVDADLFPEVDPQVVADFKALRKQKRAPITKTAIDKIASEAGKAGITLEAALRVCCSRGWQGFEAEWVSRGDDRRSAPRGAPDRRDSRHNGFENIDYSEGIENGRIT